MISRLVIAALLTITDPSPAPAASDVLVAPTSAMYRSLAPFALREISLLDSALLEFRIRLGSYANPLGLENGFSHPVIEIYVGGGETGRTDLLPGSGMRLPDGETWSVALHLTGDDALGFAATADGVREFTPELSLDGEYLYVRTDLPTIEDPAIAAMTGLYSPFHADGWRPLGSSPGPWAFYSAGQAVPVVDVLALDEEVQKAALESGILPVTAFSTVTDPDTVWFVLMAAGVGLAGAGLIVRAFSRSAEPVPAAAEGDAPPGAADGTAGALGGDDTLEDEEETEEEKEPAGEGDGEAETGELPEPDEAGATERPAPAPDDPEVADLPALVTEPVGADGDDAGEAEQPAEADEADEPLPELADVDFGEFGSWLGKLGSDGDDDAAGSDAADGEEPEEGKQAGTGRQDS